MPLVRLIDGISTFSGLVAAWLIAPLIVATCFEVVSRYAFNAPTIWAYELGYMLTGSGFLLGMAYTLSRGAHIRIDVISGKLSPRLRALVDLVGYVGLMLPFVLWLSWTLYGRAVSALQSHEKSGQSAWNPEIWPFRMVFFISFALLLVQVIAETVRAALTLCGRPVAPYADPGTQ